jgi:hypothetical protein
MTLKKAEIFYKAQVVELDLGDEMKVEGEVPAQGLVKVVGGWPHQLPVLVWTIG